MEGPDLFSIYRVPYNTFKDGAYNKHVGLFFDGEIVEREHQIRFLSSLF